MNLGRRRRGSNRVNRGGSWRNDDASNFRGANRNRNDPSNRNDNQGFRLASTVATGKNTLLSNPSIPVSRRVGNETGGTSAASKPSAQRGGGANRLHSPHLTQ